MARTSTSESGFQKHSATVQKQFAPVPRSRRRFKKRHVALGCIAILLVLVVVGVPWILHNRTLVVNLINRNAGIQPIRFDLDSIEGGWISPFKVYSLQVG